MPDTDEMKSSMSTYMHACGPYSATLFSQVHTEAPKGATMLVVQQQHGVGLYRMHYSSSCAHHLTALHGICHQLTISDLIGYLASIDLVMGDIDR